jgi:hypothetical protein
MVCPPATIFITAGLELLSDPAEPVIRIGSATSGVVVEVVTLRVTLCPGCIVVELKLALNRPAKAPIFKFTALLNDGEPLTEIWKLAVWPGITGCGLGETISVKPVPWIVVISAPLAD